MDVEGEVCIALVRTLQNIEASVGSVSYTTNFNCPVCQGRPSKTLLVPKGGPLRGGSIVVAQLHCHSGPEKLLAGLQRILALDGEYIECKLPGSAPSSSLVDVVLCKSLTRLMSATLASCSQAIVPFKQVVTSRKCLFE